MALRRVNRGQSHGYELDGRKVPGVTTLIRDGIPKPALISWAAKASAEWAADHIDEIARLDRDAIVDVVRNEHNRRRNTAGVRGGHVHRFAEAIAAGQTVDVPDNLTGYVDAYLQYLSDWQPEIVAVEFPVASRQWQYAGTGDLLVRVAGRPLPDLVDVKTAASGIWPETCLQIAAYRHAQLMLDPTGAELPMPATGGGFALWLAESGTYELVPVESGTDVFRSFLHVAHVAAFVARKRDDLIGYALDPPTNTEVA